MAPKAQKKPAAKAAPMKAPKKAEKKPAKDAPMKAKKKPASAASAAPAASAASAASDASAASAEYGTVQQGGRVLRHITTGDLTALKQEWREDRDWNSSFSQRTPSFRVWLASKRWMGISH